MARYGIMNGNTIKQYGNYKLPNYYNTVFENIWGDSPDNIYAVGGATLKENSYKGIIMHFDGTEFSYIQIPDKKLAYIEIGKGNTNSSYLLNSLSVNDTAKIFKLSRTMLDEIYSGMKVVSFGGINKFLYVVIGKKIYKYSNNKLNLWKDFSNTLYMGRIWGRSEKDMFFAAYKGVGHYNGNNLKLLYATDMSIFESIIFKEDVFFLCYDSTSGSSVIIHGKLNDK